MRVEDRTRGGGRALGGLGLEHGRPRARDALLLVDATELAQHVDELVVQVRAIVREHLAAQCIGELARGGDDGVPARGRALGELRHAAERIVCDGLRAGARRKLAQLCGGEVDVARPVLLRDQARRQRLDHVRALGPRRRRRRERSAVARDRVVHAPRRHLFVPAHVRRAGVTASVAARHRRLGVVEQLTELRRRRRAVPLERRRLGRGIDDPERGPRLHRVRAHELRVLGLLGVDRQPHEAGATAAHLWRREHELAHAEARVAPRRPGVDEQRHLLRPGLGEGARVVVLDEGELCRDRRRRIGVRRGGGRGCTATARRPREREEERNHRLAYRRHGWSS